MIYYQDVINDDADPTEIIEKWDSIGMLNDTKNKINMAFGYELLGQYIINNDYHMGPNSSAVLSLFSVLNKILNTEEYEMKWQDINIIVIDVIEKYPPIYKQMLKEHETQLINKEIKLINKFCKKHKI